VGRGEKVKLLYMILKSESVDGLEEMVQEAIDDGWLPNGNLVALSANDGEGIYTLFLQPMLTEATDQ
jgi:hypothetical protein